MSTRFFRDLLYLRPSDRSALLSLLLLFAVGAALYFFVGRTVPASAPPAVAVADTPRHAKAAREGGTRATPAHIIYDEGGGRPARRLVNFDPNTADSTTLLALGLAPFQVRAVYRYRNKGGVYRTAADFARLPGLSEADFLALRPYIHIASTPHTRMAADMAEVRAARAAARTAPRDTLLYPRKLVLGREWCALNTADSAALCRVPGIGAYYARRIMQLRERLGGFHSATQLLDIDGLPADALPYFRVEGAVRRIKLNKSTLAQLRRHPYFTYYQARAVADHLRLRGPIRDARALANMAEFAHADMARLAPYLDFGE